MRVPRHFRTWPQAVMVCFFAFELTAGSKKNIELAGAPYPNPLPIAEA